MPEFLDGDVEDFDAGITEDSPPARAAGILQDPALAPAERSRLFREAVAGLGEEVNRPLESWGQRLVHVAAKHGTVEDLRTLRDAGADFRALSDTGQTPLHKAMAFNPDPDVARALVAEFGVNPDATSRCGHLAGHKAIRLGKFATEGAAERIGLCFEIHREFPSALTRTGKTACHLIAGYGSPQQMGAYLSRVDGLPGQREAALNARDSRGLAPISYAASTNANPDMVAALINAGADASVRSNEGYGLAHRAAAWNPNPEGVLRRLEEKGVPEGAGLEPHATFVPRRHAAPIPSAGWSATDLLAARFGVPREALNGPTASANAATAKRLAAEAYAPPPDAGPALDAGQAPGVDME